MVPWILNRPFISCPGIRPRRDRRHVTGKSVSYPNIERTSPSAHSSTEISPALFRTECGNAEPSERLRPHELATPDRMSGIRFSPALVSAYAVVCRIV